MAKRRTSKTARRGTSPLSELRKQAAAALQQLQRAGRRQLAVIESQIRKLDRQRQAVLAEISSTMAGGRGRGRGAAAPAGARRRGGRRRTDWDAVFSKLPKGPFRASDVREFAPGVAAGTLSQRLTAWVTEKKLRRTGSRRGTRYTKT